MRKIVIAALMGIGLLVGTTANAQAKKTVEAAKTEQTVKKQDGDKSKSCCSEKGKEAKAKDGKACCSDKAKDGKKGECSKAGKGECKDAKKGECTQTKDGKKACDGKEKGKDECCSKSKEAKAKTTTDKAKVKRTN